MVERYAEISIHTELDGSNIHRATNILTLGTAVHSRFDALRVSLEPIQESPVRCLPFCSNATISLLKLLDDQHTYLVRTWPENRHQRYGVPQQVTFTDHSNGEIEMPDWRYLKLHHICAKVLHLSGAGEVVETFEREIEQLHVLAMDGSSAKYLSEALSGALPRFTTVR